MIVSTSDSVAGYEVVEHIGVVRGSAIRTRNVAADFVEWVRNLVGAELHHYTKMMAETREQALDRMQADAVRMGADAVIGVRFATSQIAMGAAEMLAYGTAVKLRKTT